MTNKFLAGFLLTISLISTSAWSKNFYRAKTKLQLTYSTAYSKTKKISKSKAIITFSDDKEGSFYNTGSFCQIKFKSAIYKCFATYYGANNFNIILQPDVLKQILAKEMGLDDVRISKMNIENAMEFRREKDSGDLLAAKKLVMQIHTDDATESYHLISSAYKARRQ